MLRITCYVFDLDGGINDGPRLVETFIVKVRTEIGIGTVKLYGTIDTLVVFFPDTQDGAEAGPVAAVYIDLTKREETDHQYGYIIMPGVSVYIE